MNRGDLWAIVGIVLSLILGIPALSFLTTTDQKYIALLVTVGVLLIATVGFVAFFFTRPAYTILVNRSVLTMSKPHGEEATVKKFLTLYPNVKGQQSYTYRNISSNGSKKPVVRVDPWCVSSTIKPSGSDFSVTVSFPHQLRLLKSVQTWLEIDYFDTFPDNPDYLVVQIDQPTKKIEIEVQFDPSRKPTKALAFRRTSAADAEEDPPAIENTTIRWSKKRAIRSLPHGEYHVMWWW
jgi:hypothetical protein